MSSKASGFDGASLYSPNQSTVITTDPANTTRQTPSTDNSYRPGGPSGLAITANRQEPLPLSVVNDMRTGLNGAQSRLQSLSQAVGRQPGMPPGIPALVNNDLRGIGHQLITISHLCNTLQNKLEEQDQAHFNDQLAQRAAYESSLNAIHGQLIKANGTIDDLTEQLQQSKKLLAKHEKNPKGGDLEIKAQKLTEKVTNQKRRINEQQAQIETLKRKLSNGSKLSKLAITDKRDDKTSPKLALPHSATSELKYPRRRSPPVPQPNMSSSISHEDQEFLVSHLKNMNMDSGHGFPPHHGPTRMQRDNHFGYRPAPVAPSFGHFGHQMTAAVGPTNPMSGAMGSHGAYPPPATYGHYAGNPIHGPPVSHHTYGMPSLQPSASLPEARGGPSGYNNYYNHSNALVLRRNDDRESDPQVAQWKVLFKRLFDTVTGWPVENGRVFLPGVVEEATRNNPDLWEYILSAARCHKDRQGAANHALFMLRSPVFRAPFITRLFLQYIQQEILRPRSWLGFDEESDSLLKNSILPVLESSDGPFDQRRTAHQQLRGVVDGIVNHDKYEEFRGFRMAEHARALTSIAGPFLRDEAESRDAILGLHSIAKLAMECSAKMMSSCKSFTFIWDLCGVKFSHDSHVALNENLHGIAIQQKHMRVALVVTPNVSFRNDNGTSIVARSICKANVFTMH
ncbi:hypothetical protein J7T55_006405 [Diaporthe amygdali]|uniref:uncharacterized protein n=1 Tax=Phomopsis amygdali TaxID=1214568 RepID=UPI0022FF1CBD|nr:uncharacterized protein J7T55_006405 [Diaporthe amygdali]KAJ0125061.1 hypothetical protein J7T55_006405 [Diaporthe amygdali]